jgi:hypothetical protein
LAAENRTAPLADVVICTYTDARWDLLERAVASVQTQSVAPGKILLCVDHNDELLERCLAADSRGRPSRSSRTGSPGGWARLATPGWSG